MSYNIFQVPRLAYGVLTGLFLNTCYHGNIKVAVYTNPLLRCVWSGLWSVTSAGCRVLGGDGVGKGLGGVAMDDAIVLMLSGLCVAMVTMGC